MTEIRRFKFPFIFFNEKRFLFVIKSLNYEKKATDDFEIMLFTLFSLDSFDLKFCLKAPQEHRKACVKNRVNLNAFFSVLFNFTLSDV